MGRHAQAHETKDLLIKLCGLLGSEFEGERAVAALKATCLLRQAGLRWADVVFLPRAAETGSEHGPRPSAGAPLSDLRADLACCERHIALLTREEAEYVDQLLALARRGRVGFRASDQSKLAAIARRVRRHLSTPRARRAEGARA